MEGVPGTAYPVFCAAMQAAVTCEQYKEAAKIHQRLWSIYPKPAYPVAYSIGMKVFGQLNDTQQVKKLWQVARDQKLVNQYVAGSRIDAAATLGDVESAAAVLDYMVSNDLEVSALMFSSAINACKNRCQNLGRASHSAADCLFQEMIRRGLKPDEATFGALLGSQLYADLHDVQKVWANMDRFEVKPDKVMAETYITALLGRFPYDCISPKKLLPELQLRNLTRLQAARNALDDMKKKSVPLPGLCISIDKALHLMNL